MCFFWEVVGEEWFRSATIRKEIRLDENEFILMPNHIHGIIWIHEVGADGVRLNEDDPRGRTQGAYHAPLRRIPRSLGSFVAGFKAAVTSRARKVLDKTDIWQRNYYEHIIRNEQDYEEIAGYIMANPLRWEKDEENPLAGGK